MILEDFGYNNKLENWRIENNLTGFEIGRVISEHKERYIVHTEKGEFEAEITGNLRFSASKFAISNETQVGYEALRNIIEKGKTYCLLGSSGVGKSTLLNNLSGKAFMRTDAISKSTSKGRHVTSHRELIVLENGGILIDNPGMREVGITDAPSGMEQTFESIYQLSPNCRYKDCTHVHEAGCAVIMAVDNGEIDRESYENYLKLQKEKAHFESTMVEKRRKDKEFGKMMKNYKKDIEKL